jgi:hypothetical protein
MGFNGQAGDGGNPIKDDTEALDLVRLYANDHTHTRMRTLAGARRLAAVPRRRRRLLLDFLLAGISSHGTCAVHGTLPGFSSLVLHAHANMHVR